MKFGFDWPSGFGEDLGKWWTDDGPWLYYNLTNEPKGSGELKKKKKLNKNDKYGHMNTFEPPHDKTNKMMCIQQSLRSAWASVQSDQSLRCALNG